MKMTFSILAIVFIMSCGIFKKETDKSSSNPETPTKQPPAEEETVTTTTAVKEKTYEYAQPDSSICDVVSEFDDGYLCAIKPSRLDPLTLDKHPGHNFFGFGYHVVVFPKAGTAIKGVYVHLSGSFGRPYSQFTKKFRDKTFQMESATSGYIMIHLAYSNRYAINSDDECGDDASRNLDNCAGLLREDKIIGTKMSAADFSATPIEDTKVEDSITYRLAKLVSYLEAQEFKFPVSVTTGSIVNWRNISVGGHSQGSGHAAFIAKNYGVKHACLLAGIFDTYDNVPAADESADWLQSSQSKTYVDKMKAVLCADDPNQSNFEFGMALLRMKKDQHYVVVSDPAKKYAGADLQTVDAHSAPLLDPRYAAQRKNACFD
jgi:hypothetical protein